MSTSTVAVRMVGVSVEWLAAVNFGREARRNIARVDPANDQPVQHDREAHTLLPYIDSSAPGRRIANLSGTFH